MRERVRVKSVHRVAVLGICAMALMALPGTSVWATARAVGARTLAFVERTVAPAFGLGTGAALDPSIVATMTATITTDSGSDGLADPGDVIRYSTTITNSGTDATGVAFTDTIDPRTTLNGGSIVISPLAYNDNYASVGNMTLNTSILTSCIANPLYSVTCNDTLNGGSVTAFGNSQPTAGGTVANGINTVTTAHGSVVLNANGTFTYNPTAGYSGADEFWYTVANTTVTPNLTDTGKVTITIGSSMVWFISQGGSGTGTQGSPASMTSFQSSNPSAASATIVLLEGSHTGPLTLLASQLLLGQDATTTVAALGGPAPQPGNAYLSNGGGTVTISGGTGGVTLSTDNTIAGFTVGATPGVAITGGAVNTLKVREVVIANNNGGASAGGLAITTSATVTTDATFTGFTSVWSTGGTNGVLLTGVTGTLALGSAPSAMSNGSGTGATFSVVNSSATITYSGNISQTTANPAVSISGGTASITFGGNLSRFTGLGPLVSISGGHQTGTITFNGTLDATTGTGLQFDNADGTYAFNGTPTLGAPGGGNDAGIDILNGSSGTFTFPSASSITNPSGVAFNVDGGSAAITYSGTITQNNAQRLISVSNTTGGSVTFNTAAANGLAGGASSTGILIDGAIGSVTVNNGDLNGTKGIEILGDATNNATGTFTFNNVTIDTVAGASNHAFIVDGDQGTPANNDVSATIDLNNVDITNPGGLVASIKGMSGGSVDLDAASAIVRNNGGLGILVDSNAAGSVTFNGTTKTLNTAANAAVTLTNNGATISFAGGGLDIDTTSGAGFTATGGGTIAVAGSSNTITSTGAVALNLDSVGSGGFTFDNVTAAGGANGVRLASVTGSAIALGTGSLGATSSAFQVGDGSGTANTGGTAAITYGGTITTTGTARSVNIQDRAAGAGNITLSGTISHASGDGSGIFMDDNAAGTITFSAANSVLNGGTQPAVSLTDNTGATITFSGGGLDIDATSGAGFLATGGGVVNVSGTNNNINTTGGTALNWNGVTSTGTVTFNNVVSTTGGAVSITSSGATDFTFNDVTSGTGTAVSITTATGDFVFHAVNANGGAKGISVTSATGTFVVNGTSTTDGTGGTIQNATGRGAEFISSSNITLKNMNFSANGNSDDVNCGDALGASTNTTFITNASCESQIHLQSVTSVTLDNVSAIDGGSHGVVGVAVNGLTLTNVEALRNGSNTIVGEDGVQLVNLSGTVNVTGGIFRDNSSRSFEVQNNTGSPIITIDGAFFGNTNFPTAGGTAPSPSNGTANGAVLLATNGTNSASITSVTRNSTFQKIYSVAFAVDMAGNTSQNATFGQAGQGNSITTASQGITMVGTNSGGLTASVRDNVLNNDETLMDTFSSTNINFRRGGGVTPATGNWNVTIDNNDVGISGNSKSGCEIAGCSGISADDQGSTSGTFTVLIQNNSIYNVSGGINVGSANSGDHTIRATIINNTVQEPDPAPQGGSGVSVGNGIFVFSGTSFPGDTYVRIEDNDVDGGWDQIGNGDAIRIRHQGAAGSQFFVCNISPSPANATQTIAFLIAENPLTSDADGPGGTFDAAGAGFTLGYTVSNGCPMILGEGGVEAAHAGEVSALTPTSVDQIGAAAGARWAAAGLTSAQLAGIQKMNFEIADLPDALLAEIAGDRLRIDPNASEVEWYVDPTPMDDVEFGETTSATRRYADPAAAPAGRMDLLTAMMHEMGHQLGLADSYALVDRDSLMFGHLTKGERRLPAFGQAARATTMAFHVADPLGRAGDSLVAMWLPAPAIATPAPRAHVAQSAPARPPVAARGSAFTSVVSVSWLPSPSRPPVAARGSAFAARQLPSSAPLARWVSSQLRSAIVTTLAAVRRVPDLLSATLEARSGETVNQPIGLLPAGKSVTIVFTVTVDAPPVASYANDATITWTNSGSVDSNTVTTNGDRYNTSNTLVSSPDPSDFGSPVTFTATVQTEEGPGTPTPDGNVQFMHGATPLGSPVACTPNPGFVSQCIAELIDSSLPVGANSITANYLGGTHYDPSTSTNTVTQDVNACEANPIVTTNADSGAGSLRQAIADVCGAAGSNVITFDMGTVVSPITLTTGELAPTRDIVISGPGANLLTITRDAGAGGFRIFHVSGHSLEISGVTVSNGLANAGGVGNFGGGVFGEEDSQVSIRAAAFTGNNAEYGGGVAVRTVGLSSSLTIVDSTFSGNNASGSGGAVVADSAVGVTTLTLTNSTISGNTGALGGGGLELTGTAVGTITNSTIAGNSVPVTGIRGGGISESTSGALLLRNTIVATNTEGTGGSLTPSDVKGEIDGTSENNLIGSANFMTGITHGVNGNQVGVDPLLGPLASNGGPTQTHALLKGSPAVDAGNDTFVVAPPFTSASPITDQRGTGFRRNGDGADANATTTVDIGAFEMLASVEDIGDQLMVEDQAPLGIVFNVGDAASITSVTASSDNPVLLPLPANLAVTGSGSTRTLTITPAPDQSGTATVTVTVNSGPESMSDTFVLTVTAVNDPPTLNAIPDPAAIPEDAGEQTVNLSGISAGGSESQTLVVTATSDNTALIPNPTVTYTSAGATGSLAYTPVTNAHGSAIVTVTVDDGGTGTNTVTRTFLVVVNAVADTPSVPSPITTNEDQPATIVISRNPADGNEVTHFRITSITGGSLFQNDGTTPINDNDFITFAQGNAGLKFIKPPDAFGSGQITVQASVSNLVGGLGGDPVVVDITVNPIADTPTATDSSTTLNTQTTTGLVLDRSAVDSTEVTHFKITNITNGTLFQNDGTTPINNNDFITYLQGNAGLKFTPTTDSTATGSFRVQAALDNVGTGLSGTFATATITLPCTTDPVVLNNADSGAGSLRLALGLACAGSTITFDPGVVSPIGLTSAQLTIDKDMTIDGPGADQLTVARTSGTFRIMNILPGHTVTIRGLTLADGSATEGGGIMNTGSTLTIEHSALTGHTATSGSGGAISNIGTGTSASLTVINSQLSGNQATAYGGAVYNAGSGGGTGTVTLTNTTVSGNTTNFGGGGLATFSSYVVTITNSTLTNNRGITAGGGLSSGPGGTITLRNTIVAGNFTGVATDRSDISAVIDTPTSFNNVIGVDSDMVGLTHGANGNQVGSAATPIEPRLGPLQDNGGPTATHALLAGSPALDAGDNGFVVTPPFLSPFTDQRGPGFGRIFDAADVDLTATVDIGAFEASVAVEEITDKATNEDQLLSFSFNVGDAAEITSVTATSDNPTLVPNLTANLEVTGSGSTRTLNIIAAPNQNGTATITVTVNGAAGTMSDTFVLTVGGVNDQPTLDTIPDPAAIPEDAGLQTVNLTGISAGPGESQTLVVTATSDNTAVIPHPTVTYTSPNATGSLSYTPVANMSGAAIITVTVNDGGGGPQTIVRTFTVNVNPVNDAPTLDPIADPAAINEDAALQTVNLSGIGAGGGESQTLVVTATSDNTALIPHPTVTYTSPNATGSLAYTTVPNANGTAIITVTVTDSGGGTNTFSRTFTVTVNSVNDPPFLDTIPNPAAILEDAGLQTVNLSGIATGAANELQTLVVTATSDNTALIPNPTVTYTSPNSTGSLSYTPVANANGTAIITVTVNDGGGGTQTVSRTFTVTVNAVNDPPTLNAIGNPAAILEDAGLQTVNLSGISAGGGETQTLVVTASSNNTALIPDPTVNYTSANATGSLSYTPVANMSGSAIITVTVNDGGSGTNTVTRTFTVQVNAQNDLPTIAPIAGQQMPANTSLGVPVTVGDVETAPGALVVTATSNNQTVMPDSGLVVTGSGASRTLTLTPAVNQTGLATIMVMVNDGTGGSALASFVVQVLPTVSIGPAQVVEGHTGTVNLMFPVSLVGAPVGSVTVNYVTHQQSAIEGVDYAPGAGTLTFSGSSGTLNIPVTGDTAPEIDETFVVELTGATGAVLGVTQAIGTIINDDATAELVVWRRLVGVTAAAGSLTKIVPSGWGGAGASSTTAIASGDGSVEFSVLATDQAAAVGLSKGDTNTELSDIDYVIAPAFGLVYVLERGVPLGGGSFGTYAAGDRFGIVVNGGVVEYQRNGVTFHTSTVAPTYPLLVDTALFTSGAVLDNVVFAGVLTTTPRRQGDFDGDGQTDVVIYRPLNGTWYTLQSGADHTEYTSIAIGNPPDVPITGDYDGDRVADVAVYRPATFTWDVLLSSTYFTTSLSRVWGAAGDVPVPADYDGDGLTDIAVWRPSTGAWFILTSSSGFTTNLLLTWGAVGDVPVPGDYDGDGLADPAVYRPSSGEWFLLPSSTGYSYASFIVKPWGVSTDITVPGDFDGDGKFDLTVYRPSTGEWWTLQSSTNYLTFRMTPWGAGGDVPVMGDYDGDGAVDVVVYRPSTGMWWVLRSKENYTTFEQFLWGFGAQYPALRRP